MPSSAIEMEMTLAALLAEREAVAGRLALVASAERAAPAEAVSQRPGRLRALRVPFRLWRWPRPGRRPAARERQQTPTSSNG